MNRSYHSSLEIKQNKAPIEFTLKKKWVYCFLFKCSLIIRNSLKICYVNVYNNTTIIIKDYIRETSLFYSPEKNKHLCIWNISLFIIYRDRTKLISFVLQAFFYIFAWLTKAPLNIFGSRVSDMSNASSVITAGKMRGCHFFLEVINLIVNTHAPAFVGQWTEFSPKNCVKTWSHCAISYSIA